MLGGRRALLFGGGGGGIGVGYLEDEGDKDEADESETEDDVDESDESEEDAEEEDGEPEGDAEEDGETEEDAEASDRSGAATDAVTTTFASNAGSATASQRITRSDGRPRDERATSIDRAESTKVPPKATRESPIFFAEIVLVISLEWALSPYRFF